MFLLFLAQLLSKMDEQVSYLQAVCRVGGRKFTSLKQSTRYTVEQYENELKSVFSIKIGEDNPEVHPKFLCVLCQRTLKRASTKHTSTHCGGGCGTPVTWVPHRRAGCEFCDRHMSKTEGRYTNTKPKCQARGIAAVGTIKAAHSDSNHNAQALVSEQANGQDVPFEEVAAKAGSKHSATLALATERFVDKHAAEAAKCRECKNVADQVVEAVCCQELFCAQCIHDRLAASAHCTACASTMKASELKWPGIVLCRIISSLSVRCDFHQQSFQGCQARVWLKDLQQHVAECLFKPATATSPIRTVRPQSTVEDILTASPSKLAGNVAGCLTSHLVAARAQDGRLEVRTGTYGKPQVYHWTTASSVSSDDAGSSTLRRRSSELARQAELVCGGATGARAQAVAGLKRLPSTEQEQLLIDAGIKGLKPSAGTALAIKADLSLPWSQLRKLRRWLNAFGVETESEQATRSLIAKKVPSYIAKDVPMTSKSGEIVMAATVFFPDLVAVVMNHLDALHEKGRLIWHGGAIPESEIWLKIGGDHGGGSFKFSMQIANTAQPNSLTNTIPVCIFNAKDSPANLETALGVYREQLEQLQQSGWQDKSIKVFLFGDYEYQTINYGLSGSSGVRPCLHCLCTKKDMALEVASRTSDQRVRTLDSLHQDHQQYVAAGSRLN